MKRFILVDGNALLHRAFHATPPLSTSKGELINAVFGFTAMLLKSWDDLKPDFMAIAWDRRAPTFRHQAYTQYKATRGPMDETLGGQYTRVHEVVKAFGIPEFGVDGYEADDLIGTLALQARESSEEIETIVLTGDRDIMQIIDETTKILMPKKTLTDVGLYGEKEFIEKYSFKPIQIIDFKGLAGDASDNIPGVAGIGAVTATKLIMQFGSVEKIYEPDNLKTLPVRTQMLLAEGAESAVMSKKLATLDLKAPIELKLDECKVTDYKKDELVKLFKELEFTSLVKKLTGSGKDPLKGENQLGVAVEPVKIEQNAQTTDLDLAVDEVLKKMSKTGVLIDLKLLENQGIGLKKRLAEIEEEIFKTVGHEFNLSSPKQLSEVLFDELKLPVIKKTKTGRSTDEETLNELAAAHPMIPLFLEYRKLFKLVSTYVDALPKSVAEDGRIHSTFNVEGAATGRLSSTNPNLQNIPNRGQTGGEIRKAFIATPGKVLIGADYSQVELRIMAHVSGDENMILAFERGDDIHSATAAKIFNVEIEKIDKAQRTVGKTMNFATLYGQGPRALSKQLKIEYSIAKQYIDEYFSQFSKVKAWMAKVVEEGKKLGYVETVWGRRRYIPELQSANSFLRSFGERAAINHPIQGTSADMIKKAMVEIDRELSAVSSQPSARGNKADSGELIADSCNLILQVHDELLFECEPDEVERTAKMIKDKLEGVIELLVPVKVDVKSGKNWGEMSPLDI